MLVKAVMVPASKTEISLPVVTSKLTLHGQVTFDSQRS
jgi:hypothetical protein